MSIRKIKLHNEDEFLTHIKKVREVMVYAGASGAYLKVSKKEVLREAETGKILYYLTDSIFKVKRNVMVVT